MSGTVAAADGLDGRGLVLADDLAEDSNALATAYRRYLVACCRRFLALKPTLPPQLRHAHAHASALVQSALAVNRREVLRCFASPAVGAPLQCAGVGEGLQAFADRIDRAVTEMIPHVLFEMAVRGLIPHGQSVLWSHGAPALASPAFGGALVAPQGARGLRFSHSHVAAVCDDVEVARLPVEKKALDAALADGCGGFALKPCFRRVGRVTHFATIDHNPIAEFEEHPEKAGNHIDLGGRSEDEWVQMLERCFDLVERFLPAEFREMTTMLQQAIPVGYDDHRHLSASYREAVGTIYLTLHPNIMTMTEAVIHEFQHNKFNAASYSAAFMTNAFYPLYKSPVRPDPRPLWGIMLAVHAFLPVAELYRRMRDAEHEIAAHPEFERRLSDIDLKNHEGMEMLRANASFTPAGRALFDDLERLERRHMAERQDLGLELTPTEIHLA